MTIRFATTEDTDALLAIYTQYIDTPITFEYELPTATTFRERIESISSNYPYLVCEENNQIIGYAYASRQMERAAYQWNATLSIYLDQNVTSKGLGKRLYLLLIELLKRQGVKTVYGGVTIPNEKSEKLHLGLGFTILGTYHQTGYKANKWHDVRWFEKQIAPYTNEPASFIPIHAIKKEELDALIQFF